ncbi:uncharacterized protein LOC115942871 isoform X2 [Leptonychotes weddellii]|uniref:Uncharacterized protein LOC115942871 isoform X2 n=1 Tax=Leptonychotes weddellii TaxID=9713 RepID=A0A7F8RA01_LEPWE|nr:uncharacterized protein LOC115942871 isoform X2 [Leptonychotes weddellii]
MALLSIRTTLGNAQRGWGQEAHCRLQGRVQLDVPTVADREVTGLSSPVAVRGERGLGPPYPQTGLLGLCPVLNIAQWLCGVFPDPSRVFQVPELGRKPVRSLSRPDGYQPCCIPCSSLKLASPAGEEAKERFRVPQGRLSADRCLRPSRKKTSSPKESGLAEQRGREQMDLRNLDPHLCVLAGDAPKRRSGAFCEQIHAHLGPQEHRPARLRGSKGPFPQGGTKDPPKGLEPAAGRNPASCPDQVISGVLHLSEPRFFIQETQMKPSTSLRASGILPALKVSSVKERRLERGWRCSCVPEARAGSRVAGISESVKLKQAHRGGQKTLASLLEACRDIG